MQSQKCHGRSSLPSSRPQAQLNQLYQALSDTNADRIVLLVCMGLKRETIRQFEIQNCRHEDRTFMDCLHYFLINLAKPGEEWEQVVKALQVSKDPHTANEIQRTYIDPYNQGTMNSTIPEADESNYTTLVPIPQEDTMNDYFEKMEIKTETKYTEVKAKIKDSTNEIDGRLEREYQTAKKKLTLYKQQSDSYSEKLDVDLQKLIERTTTQQTAAKDALKRLKCGDFTGLAAVHELSNEQQELEKITSKLEKEIERYKRFAPKPQINASTVTKELQATITVSTYTSTSLDDYDYI